MQIEKNKEYIVDIIDSGYSGEGIAKIDNFTIFIPGAITGEKVRILIVKVLTSHAYGKILEILEKSKYRVVSDCSTYKRCGGCDLRHIEYKETLKIKQKIVQNLVNKELKEKIIVKETIGMEEPYHYRNKAQYPVGYDKNNELVYGVFAQRSHEIIPVQTCYIQSSISEKIAKYIINFMKRNSILAYDEKTCKGIVRHIVTKVGIYTNEVMVILVVNGKEIPKEKELVNELISEFPEIKTIVKNVNTKNTNVIMGKENITLYGTGYIYDTLGEYKFKISPLSFYQINPIQTEKLYKRAVELAKLKKEDIALDLYCGIGTIGIFMSKYVKKVYGVEIVEQAVEDAKNNAQINNIQNIEFICGDVEMVLSNLINKENVQPNVIFVDPPRKGLDEVSIRNILKVKTERLVYISCNPATLVRDLRILEDEYTIKEIQPVDMFPWTNSVENIALLELKKIFRSEN